ncbi:futalosine hydrolase [Deinococcus lacus]|uniref:Futalosine hydrolase n=1 Tax=Deinococcus lacus TaxID=392561 RepID=A0ABW1YDE5_9DEIO
MSKILVVVATAPEAEALGGLARETLDIVVSGVGPVAAALAAAQGIRERQPGLVVSAGIAGAFAGLGLAPGDLALSSHIIHADLGAESPQGWLSLPECGLSVLPPGVTGEGGGHFAAWAGAPDLAAQLGAAYGPMLTVSRVTGTAQSAAFWQTLYPEALTEGMEGAGVAQAAFLAGLPALELRGVSNWVGPRDRAAWRIGPALAQVQRGLGALTKTWAS